MTNFLNLDKYHFAGIGPNEIPQIRATHHYPTGKFIPANYAKTEKHPEEKVVHTFVDDYQIARWWNQPDNYIQMLKKFEAVCAPDYSTYTDMPVALQIYNHYRKHWVAAYLQMHGVTVYPTISWSDDASYSWCFDGEPTGGVVAVSSVGTQRDNESKRMFLRGYDEMMKRLEPSFVIFYGAVPPECDWNVIRIKPHYEEIRKRCGDIR